MYAYSNFIKVHKMLNKEKIVDSIIELPHLLEDRSDVNIVNKIISQKLNFNKYIITYGKENIINTKEKSIKINLKGNLKYKKELDNFINSFGNQKRVIQSLIYKLSILQEYIFLESDLYYIYRNLLNNIGTCFDLEVIDMNRYAELMAVINLFEYIDKINKVDISDLRED